MKLLSAGLILCCASPLTAQHARTPFAIADNSFLVEEAFNQERGVFQNILVAQRVGRDWSFEFTQEWPVGGIRNQLSYTVPVEALHNPTAGGYNVQRGTVALNYRFQVLEESAALPAFAPRVSLLVPTAPGTNGYGVQLNLPASKQFGNFYVHANAGYTYEGISSSDRTHRASQAAGSVIYRALPMVHVMLESVFRTNEFDSEDSFVVSPGIRGGINISRKQLVLGGAVPFGLLRNDANRALLTYVSYELPFN